MITVRTRKRNSLMYMSKANLLRALTQQLQGTFNCSIGGFINPEALGLQTELCLHDPYICIQIYLYIQIQIYILLHILLYTYCYIYVYIHMYVYIYTYVHTYIQFLFLYSAAWPLHEIPIANIRQCMAYKRGVGGELYIDSQSCNRIVIVWAKQVERAIKG